MHLAVFGHDLSRDCNADEDIEKPAENGVANGDESAASKKKKKKEKAKAAVAVEAPKESEPEPEAEDEGEVKVLDPAEVRFLLVLLLTILLVRSSKVLSWFQNFRVLSQFETKRNLGQQMLWSFMPCLWSCSFTFQADSHAIPLQV